MRISDWSSDVCSSDLRRITAQILHQTHRIDSARTGRSAGAKRYADIRRMQGQQLLGRTHQLFLRRDIAGGEKLQTDCLLLTAHEVNNLDKRPDTMLYTKAPSKAHQKPLT